LNAARTFLKTKTEMVFGFGFGFGFDFEFEFEFKEAPAVFKMSPASRWRDNIFTVGSNPQPGSPKG